MSVALTPATGMPPMLQLVRSNVPTLHLPALHERRRRSLHNLYLTSCSHVRRHTPAVATLHTHTHTHSALRTGTPHSALNTPHSRGHAALRTSTPHFALNTPHSRGDAALYDGSVTILACPVRDCGLLLEQRARAYVCARGHSHDVARSGYLNLLQPQDRRSPRAGDSKDAVQARARLLARGVGAAVIDACVEIVTALPLGARPTVVDLGAGPGDALGTLAAARSIEGIGIDLSTSAAEHAARRYPALTWVVANADRRLPLLDGCVDVVLSIHGRRHPAECARLILAGWLVVAVPAADDLVELRTSVLGAALSRDRAEAIVDEHAPWFSLEQRLTSRVEQTLERDDLLDMLRTTYRGGRIATTGAVAALRAMTVTLASDILVFARRPGVPSPAVSWTA